MCKLNEMAIKLINWVILRHTLTLLDFKATEKGMWYDI